MGSANFGIDLDLHRPPAGSAYDNERLGRVRPEEDRPGIADLRREAFRIRRHDFQMLGGKLPIATTSTMYNPSGEKMGTVTYKNVKANVGLADSLFSMSQR